MRGLMVMAYLLVSLFLFMVCLCQSDDKLTPAKPLLPGDVLISDGGAFAFGFFSLKNSTLNSYVGVWYNNIPERTFIWIANRDSPLTTNLPGKLVFTNSSDLVLLDSTGHIVWTTTNNITIRDDGAAAVLLNSGNLVVRGPDSTDIWESFQYPTDTIVPDVSISLSSTDVVKRLVAWKGPNDPSSSNFSMGGDSDLQIVVWNGTKPYWRRAAWGGNLIRGTFQRNTNFTMYQSIVDTGNGYFIKITVSDGSPSVRLTLGYTGIVRFLRWDNDTSSWTVFNQFPSPSCDQYAFCGPFAYCDSSTEVVPTCKCLDGFEPDGLNLSRGCRRQEELKCDGGDSFLTLPDMKIPDKFLYIRNKSFDQCAEYCSRNCTCTAYAYSTLENVYANATMDRSRCLVWMGMLIDTEKFNNGFGENLYLRHPSLSVSKKKSTRLKIVLPTVASFLLLLTCTWIVCKSKGNYQGKKPPYKHALQQASKKLGNDNLEYPSIAFEDIITATNNFSHSNLLGKGGFGKVYKGMLEGGKEVAVKRLSKGSTQGIEEFRNEVDLIAKLQHRNLVRLLGCCICEDEKLLIYEFLPNKSLDAFLFDATRKSMLDWPTRIKIIKGVARGILYLHQDSRPKIIHRDLKASNILLDTDMTPKISDFGMARIFGGDEQRANTTRVVGTYGYMSPEYAMDGYFSVKSDTYSFGVLMLEIVSGLKISSPDLIMDFPNLIAFAWSLWRDGKAGELVDSSVVDSCSSHEVLRCIHLGLLCVQDQPDTRPLMSSIVFMLENDTVPLPTPKQPVFFTRKFGTDQPNEYTRKSLNNMSITTMEGR